MSQALYKRVIAELATASCRVEYEHARILAEGCDPCDQMALVDHFVEASYRLGLRERGES